MQGIMKEPKQHNCEVDILSQIEEYTQCQIAGTAGELVMTRHQVFSGIELIYNDVHLGQYTPNRGDLGLVLEINYCREGRMEGEFQDEFFYLTPGDLSIRRKKDVDYHSTFPLHHYHGITIAIDIQKAPDCLSCLLDDVNVRPIALLYKFCKDDRCFIARSNPYIEHIFSELYTVPDCIKRGYFKVKVLELLLFLSSMELAENEAGKRCVPKKQVSLAKAVCQYLTKHIEEKITIATLAERFHVSQTALKCSFKGVYGMSVYAFIRQQKMQAAALLLRQSDHSVLEIAGRCGYDNASKFASAFRDEMGMSPNEYRITKNKELYRL